MRDLWGGPMSALTDQVAREHQRVYNRPHATCLCGWDRTYSGDQQPYLRHVAEVTERAVREQVAEDAVQRLARAAFQVDSTRHINVIDGKPTCLCGFVGNARARTQTEHITAAVLEEFDHD